MKKIISILLVTVMLLATMAVSVSAAPKVGDIDGDGKINSADALLTLQHSVGSITITGDKSRRADVNADGVINSADALVILQIAVGSYKGDIGNDYDDPDATPYERIVNYVLKYGNYNPKSGRYTIMREWVVNTYVIYDPAEDDMVFAQQSGSDYPSYLYLLFEPGAARQDVLYEAYSSDGQDRYQCSGYIYTSTFSSENKTVHNFKCNVGYMYEATKFCTESDLLTLFLELDNLFEDAGLNVKMRDLGFTSWEY